MYHFKHDKIAEWMNEISIYGETYSKLVRQQIKLYSTSSCSLFKDYMETRRSEWEEEKEYTSYQVRASD